MLYGILRQKYNILKYGCNCNETYAHELPCWLLIAFCHLCIINMCFIVCKFILVFSFAYSYTFLFFLILILFLSLIYSAHLLHFLFDIPCSYTRNFYISYKLRRTLYNCCITITTEICHSSIRISIQFTYLLQRLLYTCL